SADRQCRQTVQTDDTRQDIKPYIAPTSKMDLNLSTLYVGDLHPNVTESMLVQKFSPLGQIHSVRVCRCWKTHVSLGYAYVNFYQQLDAERALAKLNYAILMGKPMRVMWCQKDSTLRRSGVGNLFIKNLDLETTNSTDLFELFSFFGKVLSCKKEGLDLYVKNLNEHINDKFLQRKFSKFGTVTGAKVMMQNGRSRGYGFVRFLSAEDAMKAKEEINGTVWGEMKVFVDVAYWCKDHQNTPVHSNVKRTGRVQTRNMAQRKPQDPAVEEELVPLLDPAVAEEPASPQDPTVEEEPAPPQDPTVEEETEPPQDPTVEEEPAPPQDGYVQFESQEAANLAKKEGLDLYVKNLDEHINHKYLQRKFSKFGTVTGAKVIVQDGRSRGYGFVRFLSAEDAMKAKEEINGTVWGKKKVFVDVADWCKDHQDAPVHSNVKRTGRVQIWNMALRKPQDSAVEEEPVPLLDPTVEVEPALALDPAVEEEMAPPQDPNAEQKLVLTQDQDSAKGRSLFREGLDLYVKNLDEHINHNYLQRIFSKFGPVIGTTVMMQDGRSKGYGFVRFLSAEDAMKAKEEINGTVWGENKVFVDVAYWCKDHQNAPVHSDVKRTGRVQTRSMARRKKVQPSKKVVTEKPQDPAFEEEPVPPLDPAVEEEPASPLDPVAKEEPASSQDGYVQFESQEAANLAKKEGLDLYVKNLDEHINHKYLQRKFSKFGTVTGAKVMMQDGRSRGYGFVRFLSAEDAMKAKEEINGTVWGKNKVFVDVANWHKDHQNAPVHSNVKRTGGCRFLIWLQEGHKIQPSKRNQSHF
ncbi:hypothetical protein HF521_005731, partial [Silurus meridionalis]